MAGGPAAAQSIEGPQQTNTIRNTFGEVGILDMPSAHMAKDGELAFTVGAVGTTQRYNLSFQALPWLEASFRYSHVPGTGAGRAFYDRSFGTKIRLVRENTYLPDVSVGLRDILGTGVYSSEYLAASKHIGPVDLTAGLGWGRLADTGELPNPIGLIFPSFKTRAGRTSSTGGTLNLSQYFHGPRVGVFGGAIWQTPIPDLNVMAEYSSDKYTTESTTSGGIKVRSPLNVGFSYQPFSMLTLSGGWFYGTTVGVALSIRGDLSSSVPSSVRLGPEILPAAIRTSKEQADSLSQMLQRNVLISAHNAEGIWVKMPTEADRAKQNLMQALLSEGIGVRDIEIEGKVLLVDASRSGDTHAQCARYAQIVAASGSPTTILAMSDLQSSDGVVTFCPIVGVSPPLLTTVADRLGPYQVNAGTQASFERKLASDLDRQSLLLDAVSVGSNELWLYFENFRYLSESEAIGRAARVLMADAPPSVEIFHFVSTSNNVPLQQVTVARSALERAATTDATAASELGDAIFITPPSLDNPALDKAPGHYPRIYWTVGPKLTEHIFDPDRPLQFQLYADAEGAMALAPGLAVGMGVTANIYNDFNFARPPDSVLPHVRTDVLKYLKRGADGISYLNAVYKIRLARDVVAEVNGGYLEDMFAGAGGQILWRPEGSRFAIGADLYQVWKRDFNRLFGLQSYNVLTGHASIYYESPWYGLNFNLHMGRYLAGDYGATLEVTRRFSTGVEIGAFATFTNVPFSKFGEGSFDKGIIIRIPFEWELPVFSQSAFDLIMHSLTRDGGQRLSGDDSLYGETRRTSYSEISEHLDEVVNP